MNFSLVLQPLFWEKMNTIGCKTRLFLSLLWPGELHELILFNLQVSFSAAKYLFGFMSNSLLGMVVGLRIWQQFKWWAQPSSSCITFSTSNLLGFLVVLHCQTYFDGRGLSWYWWTLVNHALARTYSVWNLFVLILLRKGGFPQQETTFLDHLFGSIGVLGLVWTWCIDV